MILDHIARARRMGLAYVYLGYWVHGSRKMDYKGRFLPQERLTPDGWTRVERRHLRLAPRPFHSADERSELVALGKALRRQSSGIGAVAAPVGKLLEREREDAPRGVDPGHALLAP